MEASAIHPANDVVQFRFGLRSLMFAIFVIAMMLWFFLPVAAINSASCKRIKPGMTLEQATDIIGAPPDNYDGIWQYSSSYYDDTKGGHGPSWIGWQGELVIELDEKHRVKSARLYSIEVHEWSVTSLLWERFTRVKYSRLTASARALLFLVQGAVGAFVIGMVAVPSRNKNEVALHGVIGLLLGLILALANFSHGFVIDSFVTLFALGPIVGAFVGIAVGSIGEYCAGRNTSESVT